MRNPGAPSPAQYEGQLKQYESAREQMREGLGQLQSKKQEIIAVLNNPQVPPEQKAQYRSALSNIESQIQELTKRLEMVEGAIRSLKQALIQMAGMMSGGAQAEQGANRG